MRGEENERRLRELGSLAERRIGEVGNEGKDVGEKNSNGAEERLTNTSFFPVLILFLHSLFLYLFMHICFGKCYCEWLL